jgi:hypothetical protein
VAQGRAGPVAGRTSDYSEVTPAELKAAVEAAEVGARLVYHRGSLPHDRNGSHVAQTVERSAVGAIAKTSLELSEKGRIHLTAAPPRAWPL